METEEGAISIPVGWDLQILPRSVFALFSPDREIIIDVLAIEQEEFDRDLRATTSRHLRNAGGPKDIGVEIVEVEGQPTYRGKSTVSAGRVFAGCGVRRKETPASVVVSVARLTDTASVAASSFEAAGGVDLLCAIAASATGFALR